MPKHKKAFQGHDSLSMYGTKDAPIKRCRKLMSKAVKLIITSPDPAANIGRLMN